MRDRRARPVGSRRRARDHAPTRADASVESIEDSKFGFEPARAGGGIGAAARALAATSQDNMPARQRSRSLSRTHGEIGRRSGGAPRASGAHARAERISVRGRVIATIERCGVRLTARVAARRGGGRRRDRAKKKTPESRWEPERTCCRGAATPSWSWCWRPCRWRPRGPC